MRQFTAFVSVVVVMLLATIAPGVQPRTLAQEATPTVEDFTPEGITFEPIVFATGLALPSTGEISASRVGFEPGAGFSIEEGDPTYALAVIESGELAILVDGPLVVTRAGALETAMGEAEAGGAYGPATEEIAAGQEVTLQAGDTVLFPPNAGGEVGNRSQERAVVLVFFVGPPPVEGTPTAGTPTP